MAQSSQGGGDGRDALEALLRLTERLCGGQADFLDAPERVELLEVTWQDGCVLAPVVRDGRSLGVLRVSGVAGPDPDLEGIVIDAAVAAARALPPPSDAPHEIPSLLLHVVDNAPAAM